ncbi:MAG: ABC transporter permease, partial [Acidobacteria bacterium]|nr:ABC transporter permease [Acidobacteriota bacterium]
ARMLLVEAGVLALAGGLIALAVAPLGLTALLKLMPTTLPRAREIEFGTSSFLFVMTVAFVAAVLIGIGPAMRAGRVALRGGLNTAGRSATPSRRRRWGLETLVLVEVAIATLLLASTGLFLKSYAQLQKVSPGFEPSNVLMVSGSLPPARYAAPEALQRFAEAMQSRLAAIPGVASVAASSGLPMSGINNRLDFEIAGKPPSTAEEVLTAQNRHVSPGIFHTLRIPLLEGREFTEADSADAQRVVILDSVLAQAYFPGRTAVGEHLIIQKRDHLIIGVAGEVKHFGLDDPPLTTFYQPLAQIEKVQASFVVTRLNFVLRTRVEPLTLAQQVRETLAGIDPEVPATLRTMDQFLQTWVAPRRFNLQVLSVFAGFSILLTASGIYAVLATAARQRTQEIGIRLALGATRRAILQMILRRAVWICGAGILSGIAAARLATQPIRGMLYKVEPFDGAIFASVCFLVLLVGLVASFLPAWRASRVDPLSSIRGL